ncbi:MAG: serine/threonine protein kinase, partial [Planctomycetes bacterium]|nr:serine/threonine protein kinase [Planctomycetota bacterium]
MAIHSAQSAQSVLEEKLCRSVGNDGSSRLTPVVQANDVGSGGKGPSESAAKHNDVAESVIAEASIIDRLPGAAESKSESESKSVEPDRYALHQHVASQKNNDLFYVHDAHLNRVVEARVLRDRDDDSAGRAESAHSAVGAQAANLIHEAVVLSHLDHPGIPPVYDLDRSENGQLFCTVKRVQGHALSTLIHKAGDSEAALQGYDKLAAKINVFIKICEIIAYAHSRDVIHLNLKPDNFIIGDFGEVYVIAWDSACEVGQEGASDAVDGQVLRGTPMYMSPEQAQCLQVDTRSDIYALGASLFHMLLKRPPLMRDNEDDFWQAKKQGQLDAYEAPIDENIPAPLLAIMQRCLAADPADRYQELDVMIVDLKQYQSGQMVAVHEYGMLDVLTYWLKNNRLHVKWAVFLMLFVLLAGVMAYYVSAREQTAWGDAIYTENFADSEEWKNHWVWGKGNKDVKFIVEDNALVTKKGPEFLWFYDKRLSGGVAIEFDGKIKADATAGDLSIVYCSDIE